MSEHNAVPIFDGSGFSSWLFRLKLFLEVKECSSMLEKEPTSDANEKVTDAKARNFIVRFLSDSQLDLVVREKTAKAMIDTLKSVYERCNVSLQILAEKELMMLCYSEKQPGNEFLNQFEAAVNKVLKTGKKLDEDTQLHYFLLKLPESMKNLVDLVDVLPADISKLSYVKAKFLSRTSQSGILPSSSSQPCQSSSSPSLSSQSTPTLNESSTKEERYEDKELFKVQRKPMVCHNCGKKGHIKKYCWSNRGKNFKNRNFKNNYGKFNRGRGGHRRNGNNSGPAESFLVEINSGVVSSCSDHTSSQNLTWLVDSGATDHIVCKKEYFTECVKLNTPVLVKMGDEFPCKSHYIGNVNVKFKVGSKITQCKIKNVYLVEEVSQNLLSVSTIDDHGYKVILNRGSVEIYNPNNEKIAIGKRRGKLYEINCEYENFESSVYTSCTNNNNDKRHWHRLLGHVNFSDLRNLCNEHMVDGLPNYMSSEFIECDICKRNKIRNLSFGEGRSRASDVLEIVHTDVNGPHKTLGNNEERFFVTFIDDYSKFVVVYAIKAKSEV